MNSEDFEYLSSEDYDSSSADSDSSLATTDLGFTSASTEGRDDSDGESEVEQSDEENLSKNPKNGKIDFIKSKKHHPIILGRRLPPIIKYKYKLENGSIETVILYQKKKDEKIPPNNKLREEEEPPKKNFKQEISSEVNNNFKESKTLKKKSSSFSLENEYNGLKEVIEKY